MIAQFYRNPHTKIMTFDVRLQIEFMKLFLHMKIDYNFVKMFFELSLSSQIIFDSCLNIIIFNMSKLILINKITFFTLEKRNESKHAFIWR